MASAALGNAAKFCVGCHVALTGASVASSTHDVFARSAGAALRPRDRDKLRLHRQPTPPLVIIAATRTVQQMYAGGGLDPAAAAPAMVFEDPLALCVGEREVVGASLAALSGTPRPASLPAVLLGCAELPPLARRGLPCADRLQAGEPPASHSTQRVHRHGQQRALDRAGGSALPNVQLYSCTHASHPRR
jgi:hypothetical protein